MKKISLLVLDKYKQDSLLDLRRLGLVHIKYIAPPASPDIDSILEQIEGIDKALQIIFRYPLPHREEKSIDEQDALSLAAQIISWDKERANCRREREEIKRKISWYKDWGKLSPNSLKELAAEGVYIRLYKCSRKELRLLRKRSIVEVIKAEGHNYYIAVVSFGAKENIALPEILPPDEELELLNKKLKATEEKISSLENLLTEQTVLKKVLLNSSEQLQKSLDFNKVKSGMQQEGEISCLQGFMPAGEITRLVNLAKSKGWAYLIQDPDNLEEVPTLIKNPAWLRIIEPVFKFMGTLPGYNEQDISLVFLLFFSLFFALLIGDAGYGLLFFIATYFIRKKLPDIRPEAFMLMYVLSFATVIWGAVSGTWFGVAGIARLPFFKTMVISRVNSFMDINQGFMMYICFLIGAVHLTLAHASAALKMLNSLKALAQAGWILIIWGLFFVADSLVLGKELFRHTATMFFSGITLTLFFSHPQKNFLKGIGITLTDLPLRIMSSFSDIVSYLRLFAVGYATVAVAASFNNLALRFGFNDILGGFIAALILFLGHGLNILLGLMAVIVHGIRLNMLEFSSHLGMQWSGIEYKPFKE
ncbi:V-type ATP synthase subunit I [Candidatus Omnitrophota bacterium]